MDYERGLTELYKLLKGDAALELEFRNYEAQLRENLRHERLYGSNEQFRSDRARIVYELNRLAARKGTNFTDLCDSPAFLPSRSAGSAMSSQGQPASSRSTASKRTKAYISYHPRDKAHLDMLHTHLTLFVRKGMIDYWDRTEIVPGADLRDEISKALEVARVAIILVSPEYLAAESPDPIASYELPTILQAAYKQEMTILSVIVRPCDFASSDLEPFQPVNSPELPLSRLKTSEREKIWMQVVRYTMDILK
jgi:hypothetical protein